MQLCAQTLGWSTVYQKLCCLQMCPTAARGRCGEMRTDFDEVALGMGLIRQGDKPERKPRTQEEHDVLRYKTACSRIIHCDSNDHTHNCPTYRQYGWIMQGWNVR